MAGIGMPRCVTTSNSVKVVGTATLPAFRASPARTASRAGSSARARGSQQVLAADACPFSASQREHLPFMGVKDGPYKMTMGVQPLDWNDWIEIDEWYEEEIEMKRQMLAEMKHRTLHEEPEVGIDPNPDLDQYPPQTDEEKEAAKQRAMSRGPITVVAKRPEVATKLSKAVRQLSPEFAAYKTMTGPVKEVALDYLDKVSANPSELLVPA
ncbi:hypothetical protein DUNSADRAFT_1487 [Dunaliella salina]|uniref:Uncharacterized protein n=1 Tax=Dunaliella salina TaxID=3046 RepID=A0ABQ7FXF6_DUNSA|nr:hypothetical protein DUNSADRAFT_1487 [Dunaliella salina]|eukprot:KAF5827018.1 hypothetical protein DUNSADRAFT_1487 [Dunaliella salina]